VRTAEEATRGKKKRLRSRKPRITTVGIRCADHATPCLQKSWHYFANKRRLLGRYSSLADQSHGVHVRVYNAQHTSRRSRIRFLGRCRRRFRLTIDGKTGDLVLCETLYNPFWSTTSPLCAITAPCSANFSGSATVIRGIDAPVRYSLVIRARFPLC
jgi:hypothetical protein